MNSKPTKSNQQCYIMLQQIILTVRPVPFIIVDSPMILKLKLDEALQLPRVKCGIKAETKFKHSN